MDTNHFTPAHREEAYARGAKISTHPTPYTVKEMVTALVYSAVPGAVIHDSYGFFNDEDLVISFNMPGDSGNWVAIINNATIRKSGIYCLKVFHLREAIDFSQYRSSSFQNRPFADAYALMCMSSDKLLHNYSYHLTPEGLVVEMLCNKTSE